MQPFPALRTQVDVDLEVLKSKYVMVVGFFLEEFSEAGSASVTLNQCFSHSRPLVLACPAVIVRPVGIILCFQDFETLALRTVHFPIYHTFANRSAHDVHRSTSGLK